jgi:hypothetical protein
MMPSAFSEYWEVTGTGRRDEGDRATPVGANGAQPPAASPLTTSSCWIMDLATIMAAFAPPVSPICTINRSSAIKGERGPLLHACAAVLFHESELHCIPLAHVWTSSGMEAQSTIS